MIKSLENVNQQEPLQGFPCSEKKSSILTEKIGYITAEIFKNLNVYLLTGLEMSLIGAGLIGVYTVLGPEIALLSSAFIILRIVDERSIRNREEVNLKGNAQIAKACQETLAQFPKCKDLRSMTDNELQLKCKDIITRAENIQKLCQELNNAIHYSLPSHALEKSLKDLRIYYQIYCKVLNNHHYSPNFVLTARNDMVIYLDRLMKDINGLLFTHSKGLNTTTSREQNCIH